MSVLERLAALFVERGVPDYLRSDNGSEFTARLVRDWLERVGVKTLFIEPASPWENGYVESFNGKFRDECLNGEIFYTLREAKVLIEGWRREYNRVRPHSALGYRPPAPEVILPLPPGSAPLHPAATAYGLTCEGGPITGGRSGLFTSSAAPVQIVAACQIAVGQMSLVLLDVAGKTPCDGPDRTGIQ